MPQAHVLMIPLGSTAPGQLLKGFYFVRALELYWLAVVHEYSFSILPEQHSFQLARVDIGFPCTQVIYT